MGDSIENYLKEGINRGFSIDTLKTQLINGGFPSEKVDSAIQNIKKTNQPIQALPNQPLLQKQKLISQNKGIPIGVKISSYIYYLIATIILVKNIIYLVTPNASSSLLSAGFTFGSFSPTVSLILSFVIIIIPILFARGIWNGKNGYRIIGIIVSFLVIIGGIISLILVILGSIGGLFAKISFSEIINLVIAIILIIFLLFDKKTKNWFKEQKRK